MKEESGGKKVDQFWEICERKNFVFVSLICLERTPIQSSSVCRERRLASSSIVLPSRLLWVLCPVVLGIERSPWDAAGGFWCWVSSAIACRPRQQWRYNERGRPRSDRRRVSWWCRCRSNNHWSKMNQISKSSDTSYTSKTVSTLFIICSVLTQQVIRTAVLLWHRMPLQLSRSI